MKQEKCSFSGILLPFCSSISDSKTDNCFHVFNIFPYFIVTLLLSFFLSFFSFSIFIGSFLSFSFCCFISAHNFPLHSSSSYISFITRYIFRHILFFFLFSKSFFEFSVNVVIFFFHSLIFFSLCFLYFISFFLFSCFFSLSPYLSFFIFVSFLIFIAFSFPIHRILCLSFFS
ncbi:unnamed protein product [Acanthosepion pharaonis]|uniref:Uncharacterized protein n=1 Tax=Acanthosepion pharaonis TaxID=158019 RepID=A0A812B7F4_ACAPH|nr:unnamed protein product [Sepia pharaonis]